MFKNFYKRLKYCKSRYKIWRLSEAKHWVSAMLESFETLFPFYFLNFPPKPLRKRANPLIENCIAGSWCCGKSLARLLFEVSWHCLRRGGSELSPFQESWGVLGAEVLFPEERASTIPLLGVFEGFEWPKALQLEMQMPGNLQGWSWGEGVTCDSKKGAGDSRMEKHPADSSYSMVQCNTCSDFCTWSESYPCDFPSVALLWIVYFATRMCCLQILSSSEVCKKGRQLAGHVSRCLLQQQGHTMKQFLPKPLYWLSKSPKADVRSVFCNKGCGVWALAAKVLWGLGRDDMKSEFLLHRLKFYGKGKKRFCLLSCPMRWNAGFAKFVLGEESHSVWNAASKDLKQKWALLLSLRKSRDP